MPPTISLATAVRFASSASRRSGGTERFHQVDGRPEKLFGRLRSRHPRRWPPALLACSLERRDWSIRSCSISDERSEVGEFGFATVFRDIALHQLDDA